ncbi:MAG: response regulator [Synechococcales cyanobacterium CRU_2_2]|nr:response regulator [Synechococcales cyanobacterium CRU_2_2]
MNGSINASPNNASLNASRGDSPRKTSLSADSSLFVSRQEFPQGCSVKLLSQTLPRLIQSQLNGRLFVTLGDAPEWSLDFRVGRLVWATGGEHRFRRWQRSLRQFSPNTAPNTVQLREKEIFDHWEYLALSVMIKRQHITREAAAELVESTILEVLFDLLQAAPKIREICVTEERQSYVGEPIAILSNAELLGRAQLSLEAWQAMGLGKISPNAAPRVREAKALEAVTSPKTYNTLCSLLKGQLSFRDLSAIMRHELPTLGRSLLTYLRRELVVLDELPDLDSPYAGASNQVPSTSMANLPLIFCIDDSPQICYIMEETLRAAGYRCMSVQDSIQALSTLIKQKPSVIFLDLVMPVANGYEICSQIRRVAAFRKTPIIILTGNDGVVDRVRAKAVGATDFMSKPVDSERILQAVQRYLNEDIL